MCLPILRSIGTQLTKLENIYLTSRDAKTYLMASGFFKIPGPQWAQSGLHIMQTYIWPILKKKR